ncbi:MAG: hypothetical protein ACRDIB_05675, partial [Ardenticatenaceae bacterium]
MKRKSLFLLMLLLLVATATPLAFADGAPVSQPSEAEVQAALDQMVADLQAGTLTPQDDFIPLVLFTPRLVTGTGNLTGTMLEDKDVFGITFLGSGDWRMTASDTGTIDDILLAVAFVNDRNGSTILTDSGVVVELSTHVD